MAATASSVSSAGSTLELLESLSSRSFGAIFEFDPGGEELKLGITARIVIHGRNEENSLSLPRQAIFQEDGGPVVFIKGKEGWQPRDIQIKYLTESRAVLEGIEEGTEVALVNPDSDKSRVASESNPLSSFSSGANP